MVMAAVLGRSVGICVKPATRGVQSRGKPVLTGLRVMDAALLV